MTQGQLWGSGQPDRSDAIDLGPGALWLRRALDPAAQRTIAHECHRLMNGPAGGYTPTVRGGGRMHVRMLCLGRHWNPLTYRYESTRSDHDGAAVAPVPEAWVDLASTLARRAGFDVRPDVCLINFYDADGRMGLHQDKDESPASLAAGCPVISLSIGDTARFLFGGLKRKDPVQTLMLESGDVVIFGGAARLRYHGVSRILPGTAPASLDLSGRLNLTFRKY